MYLVGIFTYMKITDLLLEIHTTADLTSFQICEAVDGWKISESSAFKKGKKKYRNDKVVVSAMNELINFIIQYDDIPPIREYPHHLNVHQIKRDKRFPGSLWAHLKGQKIGLLFYVNPNLIQLVYIGTHQQLGWS